MCEYELVRQRENTYYTYLQICHRHVSSQHVLKMCDDNPYISKYPHILQKRNYSSTFIEKYKLISTVKVQYINYNMSYKVQKSVPGGIKETI